MNNGQNHNAESGLIIALGAGMVKKTPQDPPYMWIGQETELRAAAAAKLWQQDSRAMLIFSGGRPAGSGSPSEAETMQGYVERLPWNVPAINIVTDDNSIDTASNVRNVVGIIEQNGFSKDSVTLIAGKSNLARAAAYFRAYGICVTPELAREVLGDDIRRLGLPTVSDAMSFRTRVQECLLRLEQLVDRKGRLVTLLREWQLRRQHRNDPQYS